MAAFELYSVDAQLQHSSKCLLEYFTTKKKAIKFAKKDSSNVNEKLTKEQLKLLKLRNQTQGRKENYLIIKNPKIKVDVTKC